LGSQGEGGTGHAQRRGCPCAMGMLSGRQGWPVAAGAKACHLPAGDRLTDLLLLLPRLLRCCLPSAVRRYYVRVG